MVKTTNQFRLVSYSEFSQIYTHMQMGVKAYYIYYYHVWENNLPFSSYNWYFGPYLKRLPRSAGLSLRTPQLLGLAVTALLSATPPQWPRALALALAQKADVASWSSPGSTWMGIIGI